MSKKKKRKCKLPGHHCWACGRRRPNEKFSGRGHRRHLCRDCARLGAEELARRQAMLDLGRYVTWEGIILKKRRKSFEQFLSHEHPQIRALAEELQEEDRTARRLMRAEAELEGTWNRPRFNCRKTEWYSVRSGANGRNTIPSYDSYSCSTPYAELDEPYTEPADEMGPTGIPF